MTRSDWLESLEPGDLVTLVVLLQGSPIAYQAVIGSIDDDKIKLELSTCIRSFVWRDTGCRPDYGWYIQPLNDPVELSTPLVEIAIDWSCA